MKIGILTYHWVFNHGANLQTLSTIGYLRRIGHEPVVINWVPEDCEKWYLATTDARQVACFKEFQEAFYPLSKLCRNAEDVAKVINEVGIEKVFIGADTLFILRKGFMSPMTNKLEPPLYCESFPNPFWGEFLEYGVDVPIMGFSIACLDTNAKMFKDQKPEIKRYLKRFSYLSARDKSTAELISFFTDNELTPEITPDPVFNFNSNVDISEFEKKTRDKFGIKKDYYLMSVPSPYNRKVNNWALSLEKEMNKRGYELIELPRQTGYPDLGIQQMPYSIINPLEWYVLLKNSKGYIGGLMHPIVICIHNEVPFFSLDYYGSSRIRGFYTDKTTSKAWQIINQCGLGRYYKNIKSRIIAPLMSPKDMVEKFEKYDKTQLAKASLKMKEELMYSLKLLNL